MKKVITYGTFDLLHHGHINLLKRAKELGDYLIVGVTSSDFDKNRGKINVKQSLMDRIEAVKATGIADEVIPEEYYGQKIDDIRNYDVDIFAMGSDWKGHFDYLKEYCDVVYLDRTQGISSTQLREDINHVSLGVVGSTSDVGKFIGESRYVSGVDVCGILPGAEGTEPLAGIEGVEDIPTIESLDELMALSDALFIANEPQLRFETARKALSQGKHVLCESPVALTGTQAQELFDLAAEKGLVFHEAIKTAYALAFSRLVLLVKSGMIGLVVDVKATCTSLARPNPAGSLVGWGPIACLPVFELLGTNYQQASAVSRLNDEGDADIFTKMSFLYDTACASFEVGTGVKSEGELIVAGTRGYIYVPSPWWKTDYFEVRFEDFSQNKRYFYQLNGEGLRDEISAFVRAIQDDRKPNLDISIAHTVTFSNLVESYRERTIPVHILKRSAIETEISFFQS